METVILYVGNYFAHAVTISLFQRSLRTHRFAVRMAVLAPSSGTKRSDKYPLLALESLTPP
jgi:hypothetical protein